jgi:WD40 repeat protein
VVPLTEPASQDAVPLPGGHAAMGTSTLKVDAGMGALGAVRFSPDGKAVAAGGAGNAVRIIDLAGGKILKEFAGLGSPIYSLAYSPDGKRLAVGQVGGRIRVIEVATGRQLSTFMAHMGNVHQLQFFPDNKRLASSGCDGDLDIWDAARGTPVSSTHVHASCLLNFTLNAAGTLALTSSRDKTAAVVDTAAGKIQGTLPAFNEEVAVVGWTPADRLAVVWDRNGRSATFDPAAKAAAARDVNEHWRADTSALTPDRSTLAVGGFENIVIVSPESGIATAVLHGLSQSVRSLDITADGRWVAAVGSADAMDSPTGPGAADGVVHLWDLQAGGALRPANPATAFAVNGDGTRAAVGFADGTVKQVDPQSHAELFTAKLSNGPIGAVAFHADGRRLAAADAKEVVRFDADGKESGRFSTPARPVGMGWAEGDTLVAGVGKSVLRWAADGTSTTLATSDHFVRQLVVSPDGQRAIAAAYGGDVTFFDLKNAAAPRPVPRPQPAEVDGIAFLPNNEQFALFDRRYGIMVWDIATLDLALQPVTQRFSLLNTILPVDGPNHLLVHGNDTFAVINIASSMEIARLPYADDISAVRYIPATDSLVVVALSGAVKAIPVGIPHVLPLAASGLSISGDGHTAVTLKANHTLIVWDLPSDKVLHEFPNVIEGSMQGGGISITPDGKVALLASEREAVVIDLTTGEPRARVAGPPKDPKRPWDDPPFRRPVISPDGHRFAVAQHERRIKENQYIEDVYAVHIWDVDAGAEKMRLDHGWEKISHIAWSPDGKLILAVFGEQTSTGQQPHQYYTMVWDAETGKRLRTFQIAGTSHTVAFFMPDGRNIALGEPLSGLELYDPKTFALTSILAPGPGPLYHASPSPDGKAALIAMGRFSYVVDVATGETLARYQAAHTSGWAFSAMTVFIDNRPADIWADQGETYLRMLAPVPAPTTRPATGGTR